MIIARIDWWGALDRVEPTALTTDKCRVLCVDDNPDNLKFYIRALERQGHAVDIALTGSEAIDRLDKRSYRLMVLDIELPDISGYEIARRVRAESRFAPLYILAVTAHTLSGDGDKVLAAGCDFYFPKPIRLEELYTLVAQCCRTPRGSS